MLRSGLLLLLLRALCTAEYQLDAQRAALPALPEHALSSVPVELQGAVRLAYSGMELRAEHLLAWLDTLSARTLVHAAQIEGGVQLVVTPQAQVGLYGTVRAESLQVKRLEHAVPNQRRYLVLLVGVHEAQGYYQAGLAWWPLALQADQIRAELVLDEQTAQLQLVAVSLEASPASLVSAQGETHGGQWSIHEAQALNLSEQLQRLQARGPVRASWQTAQESWRLALEDTLDCWLPSTQLRQGSAQGAVQIYGPQVQVQGREISWDWRLVDGATQIERLQLLGTPANVQLQTTGTPATPQADMQVSQLTMQRQDTQLQVQADLAAPALAWLPRQGHAPLPLRGSGSQAQAQLAPATLALQGLQWQGTPARLEWLDPGPSGQFQGTELKLIPSADGWNLRGPRDGVLSGSQVPLR